MPVSFIAHKGQQILYVDLTESKSEKRSMELLEETKDVYLNSPGQLLVLVNTEGAYVNQEVSARMKEYAKKYFKDKARKRAFVGVSGLKKLILKTYAVLVSGNLKLFDDIEEAKEYLVS